jgi:hypothetical protein
LHDAPIATAAGVDLSWAICSEIEKGPKKVGKADPAIGAGRIGLVFEYSFSGVAKWEAKVRRTDDPVPYRTWTGSIFSRKLGIEALGK